MRIATWAAVAVAVVSVPALAEVPGYYPTAVNAVLTTSDGTATAGELASFLGAPDDVFTGIGGQWVLYDFNDVRIVDGTGQDLNVYEVDFGAVEFSLARIEVSANGTTFFNISGSSAAAVDLVGDNTHSDASFRRSFDVGAAVAGLGASEFRYLRVFGLGGGTIGGTNGFDLDAVGLVNWKAVDGPGGVPEPATWAMLIAGFGLVGAAARRRRVSAISA
jgi:hypothetical protein